MKWLRPLLLVFLAGCTITIKPLPSPKPKPKPKVVVVHHHAKAPTPTPTPNSMVTVDSEWLDRYKKLEKYYNNYTIPQDEEIVARGDKFKVPKAVVQHYQDMIRANPTP